MDARQIGTMGGVSARGVFLTSNYMFVAAADAGLIILHQFTPLTGPALSFGPMEANGHGTSLQGLPGLRVEIERSTDLLNGQAWANSVLGTSPLEIEDDEAQPWQFYRAIAR